jgi:hypothetical protein
MSTSHILMSTRGFSVRATSSSRAPSTRLDTHSTTSTKQCRPRYDEHEGTSRGPPLPHSERGSTEVRQRAQSRTNCAFDERPFDEGPSPPIFKHCTLECLRYHASTSPRTIEQPSAFHSRNAGGSRKKETARKWHTSLCERTVTQDNTSGSWHCAQLASDLSALGMCNAGGPHGTHSTAVLSLEHTMVLAALASFRPKAGRDHGASCPRLSKGEGGCCCLRDPSEC